MKKFTLLFSFALMFSSLFAQYTMDIDYSKWSNSVTYKQGSSPIITGEGELSDSLSKLYSGNFFYEFNNEYYAIETWADYYYWFTQKYFYMFEMPELYSFYYFNKDDFGMASYIASDKYLYKHYPSKFTLSFMNKPVKINRLDKIQYQALNDKQEKRLDSYINKTYTKIKTLNNSTIEKHNTMHLSSKSTPTYKNVNNNYSTSSATKSNRSSSVSQQKKSNVSLSRTSTKSNTQQQSRPRSN